MQQHRKSWLHNLWPRRFINQAELLTVVLIVLGISALSLLTIEELVEKQRDDTEQRLGAIANNLAFGCSRALLIRDYSEIEQLLLNAAAYPGLRSFIIVGPDQRVLSEVRRAPGKAAEAVFNYGTIETPRVSRMQYVWRYGKNAHGAHFALGLDATALVVWYPIENGQMGWLRIESAVDDIQKSGLQVIRNSALFALIAIVFSTVILLLVLRPNLRAITAATDFARQLIRARGQQFPVFSGSTELEQLGNALNETSYRLHAQETALNDSRASLQRLLDSMSEGAYGVDTNGLCTFANPAFLKILGFQNTEEVLGKHLHSLIHHSHADGRAYPAAECKIYRAYLMHENVHADDEVFWRADGVPIPVEYWSSPIVKDGQMMGAIATFIDISERKRIDRMKSEFVSTVSHELRTPLTSIAGALGLIMGGALGAIPEKARHMIGIAHKNSQRLTFLINDLLDMEKLVAGKMHFDLLRQPILPLVEQALEANRTYGAERGITLKLHCAEKAAEAEVAVDNQRMMQVLFNLLSNAIKYSPDKGTVETKVEALGEVVRVTVTDHGTGIPAAFRERIFQKFSQADSSDTRNKGGTGLGLAITQELIERMGGRIGFDSVEGQGASFYFEMPQLNRPAALADSIRAPEEDAPRILVVEDEPDIARLLDMMLSRAGYAVDVAPTGQDALHALQQATYAAVTLDLMLPDMSGLEIIRQLRQQPETTHLPVVIVSAKMKEEELAAQGEFNDIDWLTKPIDEYRLLHAVESRLAEEHRQRQRVLHVEDDADLHQVIRAVVDGRCDFESASSLLEARERLALERFDVVILDLNLPDGSGWDLLPLIRAKQPEAKVVILSGEEMTREEIEKVEAVLLKSQVSPSALLNVLSARIQSAKRWGSKQRA